MPVCKECVLDDSCQCVMFLRIFGKHEIGSIPRKVVEFVVNSQLDLIGGQADVQNLSI